VPALELTSAAVREVLACGEVEVLGRMPWASNATLLVTVAGGGIEVPAVYKPRRGERPLWDFDLGTLCQREVATFQLSEALGWGLVPETVLRDGPLGPGAVQRFVDHDPDEHYFTLLEDHGDRFRAFATFDVLANNADRKAGHCLQRRDDGLILGIDHGLTFHAAWKLRTVIWDFAGEALPSELAADVERVVADGVDRPIGGLLSPLEVAAVERRAERLLADRGFPTPDDGYHSFPWPLV